MNKREKQILLLHQQGCSNIRIADELHLNIEIVRMIVNRKYETQASLSGHHDAAKYKSNNRTASQRRPKNRP